MHAPHPPARRGSHRCGAGLLRSPPGAGSGDLGGAAAQVPAKGEAAFLDDLQRRTFDFFWETAEPANGLVPDRWPSRPFSSIAAVGFALTAYPVGVERGWVDR
jgi:hypothetical protein